MVQVGAADVLHLFLFYQCFLLSVKETLCIPDPFSYTPSPAGEMKPPISAFIAAVNVVQSAAVSSDTCTGLEFGFQSEEFASATECKVSAMRTSSRTDAVALLSVPLGVKTIHRMNERRKGKEDIPEIATAGSSV